MESEKTPRITWLLLIGIIVFAFWLRFPLVKRDLPFFYNEDEAHHFNRVVNMVKDGDFNPHYFHKPALHFYLRIPVVAASFFWNVSQGHMRSIQEIKTADPFGLSGYATTASHPGIVKWNRMFSLVISLLTVVLTFFAAQNIFGGSFAGLLSAFIVSISPGMIADSATIGVDVVMCFFAALTVLLALRLENDHSLASLALAGICAGLTLSAKYNAWPITLVPLIACLLYRRFTLKAIFVSIITPKIGFLLANPYVLSEFPLFLDQAAYEIWHYKIAGHIGHTGEPGIGQALFFYNWLAGNGLGHPFLILAVAGSAISILRFNRKLVLFISFPVVYFLFMSAQRANFTRNMLVLIPFLSIMAAGFLWIIAAKIRHNVKRLILICVTPILLLPLLMATLNSRKQYATPTTDSRRELSDWLTGHVKSNSDIALSGNLNLPPQNYGLIGVTRVDETKTAPSKLYLLGFDHVIVGPGFLPSNDELKLLHLEKYIAGEKQYDRLVKNPEVRIFKFNPQNSQLLQDRLEMPRPICNSAENYCWINSRIAMLDFDLSKIKIANNLAQIDLELMSPWADQSLTFKIADWSYTFDSFEEKAGHWIKISLELPFDRLTFVPSLRVLVSQIHSPLTQKLSQDSRRLGVAIKGAAIVVKNEL